MSMVVHSQLGLIFGKRVRKFVVLLFVGGWSGQNDQLGKIWRDLKGNEIDNTYFGWSG